MKQLRPVMLLLIILCGQGDATAQINEQYSLWNQNHFLINPAAAGSKYYTDVNLGFRRQWAGISDAPKTFYSTVHTVLNQAKNSERSSIRTSKTPNIQTRQRIKHALGFTAKSLDMTAFKTNEGLITYAMHLPINKSIRLSFGVSGGLKTLSFNESKAEVLLDGDQVYEAYAGSSNQMMGNINSGIYLYSDKFFFGYSASDLLQNDLNLISDEVVQQDRSKLSIRHQLMGGYHFDFTNDLRISPAVLIKQTGNNPASAELNTMVAYKQVISAGLGYRTEDAMSVLLGLQINHFLKAGYSYDYTLSQIRNQSTGSHEIFIGLTLF